MGSDFGTGDPYELSSSAGRRDMTDSSEAPESGEVRCVVWSVRLRAKEYC